MLVTLPYPRRQAFPNVPRVAERYTLQYAKRCGGETAYGGGRFIARHFDNAWTDRADHASGERNIYQQDY